MKTRRMTMAQALIAVPEEPVRRAGRPASTHSSPACWGSSATATWPGIGQALQQNPDFPYILVRNEQAGVHMAAGFAKASNRLRTFACTSSIGPGATNMITGAALATINRLPVLLLPGDIFARRNVAPVLQQLESPATQDIGVNDCFKPVSRYWDRIYRPEQLITALPEAMRVLTSPSDCGAVTLALPQDVQAEAYDYPGGAVPQTRVAHPPRPARPRSRWSARWRRSAPAATAADRGGRRRADERSLGGAGGFRQRKPASRWRRRRRARARWPTTIRSAWARSAPPARWPPTGWRTRPTWSSASARAIPISPRPP